MSEQSQLTKSQYLNWIKECTNVEYISIGDLGDGFAYCKLLVFLYPNIIKMRDVSHSQTKDELSATNNWKVIQNCLRELNIIQKPINIYSLVTFGADANLTFMEWFYTTFSSRVRVMKCLEAAKKVKNVKRSQVEGVWKLYDIELQNEIKLVSKLKECESDSLVAKEQFSYEEIKAKEAEQAVKVAVRVASSLGDLVQKVLNQEISKAALNAKAELFSDEDPKKNVPEKGDGVMPAIEEVISTKDYAISAIGEFAQQHAKAVITANKAEEKTKAAEVDLKDQKIRTKKAKNLYESKNIEYQKAVNTVKQANYAIAVLDAYENSDQSLKERSKKTAVAAMRKVEDTLDEFDVVSRSPVNLPVFTGSKN